MFELLQKVKDNLILEHDEDDAFIQELIFSAVDYARKYQKLPIDFYDNNPISESTKRAIIMLASHLYESRDGSTGGYFSDNVQAGDQVWKTVNLLLSLDKDWKV